MKRSKSLFVNLDSFDRFVSSSTSNTFPLSFGTKEFEICLEIASRILTNRQLSIFISKILEGKSKRVAKNFGVTESYVSQVLKASVIKIRKYLKGCFSPCWFKHYEKNVLVRLERNIPSTDLRVKEGYVWRYYIDKATNKVVKIERIR